MATAETSEEQSSLKDEQALRLFLRETAGFLATVIVATDGLPKPVQLAKNDTPSLQQLYQQAFDRAMPETSLVKYGFEEIVSDAIAHHHQEKEHCFSISEKIKPHLPDPIEIKNLELPRSLDGVVIESFLAYLAQEILEIWSSMDKFDNETSFNLKQLKRVVLGDGDLSSLVHQVGFCVDCGQRHYKYNSFISERDQQTLAKKKDFSEEYLLKLRRLEAACGTSEASTDTTQLLQDILANELHCQPCCIPLESMCKADSNRLPLVSSFVAPPNFQSSRNKAKPEDMEDGTVVREERWVSPLVVACHFGNETAVKVLLQRFGANVNWHITSIEEESGQQSSETQYPTKDQYSPMYAAALSKPNKEIVRALLQHGAIPDIHVPVRYKDIFGWLVTKHPLLNLAIQNGVDTEIILLLLQYMDRKSSVYEDCMKFDRYRTRNNRKKETALTVAAWSGRVEIIQALLDPPHSAQLEPDQEAEAKYGEIDYYEENERALTPLMAAVTSGHVEAAELLLEKGADINRLFPSRTAVTEYLTPLRKAADLGHAGIVRLLRRQNSTWGPAPWSRYTCCFTWGSHSGGEGQVELQDALTGYGTAPERRLETICALMDAGATPSEFLLELARGTAPHLPKEWKSIPEDTRHEISTALLSLRTEDST